MVAEEMRTMWVIFLGSGMVFGIAALVLAWIGSRVILSIRRQQKKFEIEDETYNKVKEAIAAADKKAQEAKSAIETTSQEVANIQSSIKGFETELSQTITDLHGVTDGTLLYNAKYQDNCDGTTTISAVLYKAGKDVTKEYPAAWFAWSRRTESGEVFLQYGYSVTVNNNDYMFGGVVIGQFTRYIHMALVVGGKLLVVGSKAICLQVDA